MTVHVNGNTYDVEVDYSIDRKRFMIGVQHFNHTDSFLEFSGRTSDIVKNAIWKQLMDRYDELVEAEDLARGDKQYLDYKESV